MNYQGHFLAYGKLEELLEIRLWYCQKLDVVFLTKEVETATQGAIGSRIFRIVVQRLDEQNNVHIWRMTTGRSQTIYGEGHDDPAEERTDSALEVIEAYLSERRFEIHHASAGKPKDLILMDGTTEIIRYDKEKNRFYRAEVKSPEALLGV